MKEDMENCLADTSLNSILLLKERIIKVETLLKKYASLAKKYSELEKSHNEIVESERNAKKDAAKYLEKYCKLSKKCSGLLNKIRSLEEVVKDKIDLAAEQQNEFAKLNSVLQIYKTERKDYQDLKKDKIYLLSLVWKLLKDSKLESKDSKYKKTAEIFFKRFERDLEVLKLDDFTGRKQKKFLRTPAEEIEKTCYFVEMPVLKSVESDFVDMDAISDDVNFLSPEEIGNFEGSISGIENHKIYTQSVSGVDNNGCTSNIVEALVAESPKSEQRESIKNKDVCHDGNESGEKETMNFLNKMDRVAENNIYSKLGKFPSIKEPVEVAKNIEEVKNLKVSNSEKDKCIFLQSYGDTLHESNTDANFEKIISGCNKINDSSISHEKSDLRESLSCSYLNRKQYGGKRKDIENLSNSSDTNNETVQHDINSLGFSDEIFKSDTEGNNENSKNMSKEIYYTGGTDTDQMKASDNTEDSPFLFVEENDVTNCQIFTNRAEPGNSEFQKINQTSRFENNRESQTTISKEDAEENLFSFCNVEKQRELSKPDIRQENCEKDQEPRPISKNDSIEKMKTADVNLKMRPDLTCFDSNKPPSNECQREIKEVDVFSILENFKTVKLISPIREVAKKKSSKRNNLILNSNGKLKSQISLAKDKFSEENVVTVQDLKKTELISGSESKKTPVMIEKSTQTDIILFKNNEPHCQSANQNLKFEEISVSKDFIQKEVEKVLNNKLKNSGFHDLGKICQTHTSCNILLKNGLKYLGIYSLNHKKCEIEIMRKLLRNALVKSRSKIRSVKKRLSSWEVEDTVEIASISNKSQYSMDFTDPVSKCMPQHFIYNNIMRKRLNPTLLPPLSNTQLQLHHDSWISNEKNDCVPQRDFCGKPFENGLPDSVFHRGSALSELKKENDSSKTFQIENYRNYFRPSFRSDCDILDTKDIAKSIINYDSSVIETPSKDFVDKFDFHEQNLNSCVSETDSPNGQKTKIVPRRSTRIQDRNNRLKILDDATMSGYNSSFSSTQNEFSPDKIAKKENGSIFTPTEKCVNSDIAESAAETFGKLENKFKILFGETTSPESEKAVSVSFDESREKNISPKMSYNLRCKTNNTNFIDNGKSATVKKRKSRCTRSATLSKRLATTLTSDSYYTSEEETVEGIEKEIEESEKNNNESNFLDSIMTAMTKQTEEFKPKIPVNNSHQKDISEVNGSIAIQTSSPEQCHFPISLQKQFCINQNWNSSDENSLRMKVSDSWIFEKERNRSGAKVKGCGLKTNKESKLKTKVENELRNFLKASISSVEEGEEKIKPCIAVLENANENVTASVIVAEVMANVDEELQDFDRPAPPLTQTQHRLMTILTILSNSHEKFNKLGYKILKTIWSKLFPENFFWPDDSVEMASRFYSALCKKLNYYKGMWRFCFKAVSCMRQRWCIPIFVVFQVWPDILHNATEIQDNILVKAFVNVILHTPKSEDLRRKRQEEKILAIKHLLINFYNFEVNVTIEEFTRQLFQSLSSNIPGSGDALIFITRCRQPNWNRKYIIPSLVENLTNWMAEKISEECGFKTLEIIQEISSVLPIEENSNLPSANTIISSLYKLLGTSHLNHFREEMIIKTLCSLVHHSGVKDVLSALSHKFPFHDPLHIEIKKAIGLSNRMRKEHLKKKKNMNKLEERFEQKKREMKKKKKVKKKGKSLKAKNNEFELNSV